MLILSSVSPRRLLMAAALAGATTQAAAQVAPAWVSTAAARHTGVAPVPAFAVGPLSVDSARLKPMIMVELLPDQGQLPDLLKREAAKAIASGRTPFLMLDARTSSTPGCYQTCEKFHAELHDRKVLEALQGTYIISIDVERWKAHTQLSDMFRNPFTLPAFPVFLKLDSPGTVTGQRIDALAFESATPEGMAKPLQRFFVKNRWNL